MPLACDKTIAHQNLKDLGISFLRQVAQLTPLLERPPWLNLLTLKLTHATFGPEQINLLCKQGPRSFPNLKVLELNSILSPSWATFDWSRFTNLQSLALWDSNFKDLQIIPQETRIGKLPALLRLALGLPKPEGQWNSLKDVDKLMDQAALGAVTLLHLNNFDITLNLSSLLQLAQCTPKLEHLIFTGIELDSVAVKALTLVGADKEWPRLKSMASQNILCEEDRSRLEPFWPGLQYS